MQAGDFGFVLGLEKKFLFLESNKSLAFRVFFRYFHHFSRFLGPCF
jgi:hypothetical protein